MTNLLKFGQPLGGIMQIAYTVPDIHAALKHYTENLKIGPFFLFEHFPLMNVRYRGQPSDVDITLALGFSGSMCFELIQQNNDVPSVYLEKQRQHGWGFHHFAISSMDFDADLAAYRARGIEEAFYVEVALGSRAAYVDTTPGLPGMVEIIELTPDVENFFATLKAAADNWDGRDPVREFKF